MTGARIAPQAVITAFSRALRETMPRMLADVARRLNRAARLGPLVNRPPVPRLQAPQRRPHRRAPRRASVAAPAARAAPADAPAPAPTPHRWGAA